MDNKKMMDDLGKLVLRIAIGGLMLFHGIAKLGGGVAGIGGLLESKGLPSFIAYGVYAGEVLAPLFMIVGLWSRAAGIVLAGTMVFAIGLAHSNELLALSEGGGAWAIETPMLFLLGGVAVALLGSGRFSASGGRGKLD